jgi:bifunctional oligoribonuclease and PAP phosphatase NrnA
MSLKTNTSYEHMASLFRDAKSVVVLSHVRPDGDAIGSTAAVALALRKMGKEVLALNEDGVPETLRFMPGSELIRRPSELAGPVTADLAIAVDCANQERLGANCLQAIAGVPKLLNIDHHRSNEGYGDFHYIRWDSPAAGQILFDFLEAENLPLDAEIAKSLYVAISTDTGSFQYESVTARTYEIGAKVVAMGVNIAELNRQTYESYPLRRVALLRGLLNEMEISHEGKVASWMLRQQLAKEVGMLPEDAEGLIDTIRAIHGVVVALHLEELPDGKIRVSIRSKDNNVDVGQIAAEFGGGGHKLAAGARLAGPIEEAKKRLFHAISKAL